MKLYNMLDVNLLHKYWVERIVSKQTHPEHKNLEIYNYTHRAQHENIWDNITEQCRGLIVDSNTGDVLARPFRKFFNLNTSFKPETMEENLPYKKPDCILEKMDGSLGILYPYNNKQYIATRGSFSSDQARWANTWWDRLAFYNTGYPEFPKGYTPLFEIIYKENRIVVDYQFEGLVLLGLVQIETGFELPFTEVCEVARRNGLQSPKSIEGSLEEITSRQESNTEGFVLQFWCRKAPVPLRLKVKTEEYKRLHKIITGTNPKGIWEHLKEGGDPDALWANTNSQFFHWCQGWINTFQRMYKELEDETLKAFGRVCANVSETLYSTHGTLDAPAIRGAHAVLIQQEQVHYQPILFAMLSGKGYKKQIWKSLEPKIQGKDVFLRNGDEFNGI
jgi:RNA ligase